MASQWTTLAVLVVAIVLPLRLVNVLWGWLMGASDL